MNQSRSRGSLFSSLNGAVILAGLVILLFGGSLLLPDNFLRMVDPSTAGHGMISLGRSVDRLWVVTVALTGIAIVACAGLPSTPPSDRALLGSVAQAVGGAIALGGSLFVRAFMDGFYFHGFDGSSSGCFYESCWPLREQAAMLILPYLLTGFLMILAAFMVRRLHWWIRALIPAAVWVAAMVIQSAAWDSYLLPVFERPLA